MRLTNLKPIILLAALVSTQLHAAEEASVVTPVPQEFNGNVGAGVRKADGTVDFMEGFTKDARGGEFNRSYNGLSGKIESGTPMEDAELNALNVSFLANLYGITEIGPKFCRPVGSDYPESVLLWYFPVKDYVAAEKVRDTLLKERTEAIKGKMSGLTTATKEMQLKSIELQIETQNAVIDSLSGSSLYSLDAKANEVRSTSRIAWREKLYTALVNAQLKADEENIKLVTTAQACAAGANASNAVSTAGCNRKKIIQECDDKNNCTSREEPDPVPGSCEMIQTHLPKIQGEIFEGFVKLYALNQVPSAEIAKRFYRLNAQMNIVINSMPASPAGFDWTTPIKKCLDPEFGQHLQRFSMACTANHKEADLAKIDFTSIAPAKADAAAGVEPNLNLPTSEALSDNVVIFLKALGISEADLPGVIDYFHASWANDDLLLGQARLRLAYFEKVRPKIEKILMDDKKRLGIALLQREKLLQYYEDLKNLYQGKTSTNLAKSNTSKIQLDSALNTIQSQGLSAVTNNIPKKDALGGVAAGTSAVALSTASNQRLEVVDSQAFSGNLAAANGGAIGGANALGSFSVATNDKLKRAGSTSSRLTDIKKNLGTNSFFETASGSKGGSSKSTSGGVSTGSITSMPSMSASAASEVASAGIADVLTAAPASDGGYGQLSLSAGGYGGYLKSYGMGSNYSKSTFASLGTSKPTYSSGIANAGSFSMPSRSDSRSGAAGAGSANGETNTKLKDAVWHLENSNIKKNYEGAKNDSIFERVTKAHIRNYKKIVEP